MKSLHRLLLVLLILQVVYTRKSQVHKRSHPGKHHKISRKIFNTVLKSKSKGFLCINLMCESHNKGVFRVNEKEECDQKSNECCRMEWMYHSHGSPNCCSGLTSHEDKATQEYGLPESKVDWCLSKESISCFTSCTSEHCKKYFYQKGGKCFIKKKYGYSCESDDECFEKTTCRSGKCKQGSGPSGNNRDVGESCNYDYNCKPKLKCPASLRKCANVGRIGYLEKCIDDIECIKVGSPALQCTEVQVSSQDYAAINQRAGDAMNHLRKVLTRQIKGMDKTNMHFWKNAKRVKTALVKKSKDGGEDTIAGNQTPKVEGNSGSEDGDEEDVEKPEYKKELTADGSHGAKVSRDGTFTFSAFKMCTYKEHVPEGGNCVFNMECLPGLQCISTQKRRACLKTVSTLVTTNGNTKKAMKIQK